MSKSKFFKPENALLDKRTEYFSKSSKYKLIITPYGTKEGCWNYTEGEVFCGNKSIAKIQRNYSRFPFSFIEKHLNGHDYLICGEDYQGQTIIELDIGNRIDYLPEEAKKGFGFCWADYVPSPNGSMLAVCGCYWACPYEIRIIDFSKPLEAPWPELLRDTNHDTFDKWIDNNSCQLSGFYTEYSKVHNKSEDDLTDEEWNEIEELSKKGSRRSLTTSTVEWLTVFEAA